MDTTCWKFVHQENLLMKTNEKPINTEEKSFDAIKFVREQRDRLDAMFSKMTNEEIIAYLNKAQKTSTIRPSA